MSGTNITLLLLLLFFVIKIVSSILGNELQEQGWEVLHYALMIAMLAYALGLSERNEPEKMSKLDIVQCIVVVLLVSISIIGLIGNVSKAHAQTATDTATTAPSNIFDASYGVTPKKETTYIVSSPASLKGLAPQAAAQKYCAQRLKRLKPAPGVTNITITSAGCRAILVRETSTGATYTAELKYRRKELWDNGNVRSNQILTDTATMGATKTTIDTCPPTDKTTYTYSKKVGETTYCYDINDVLRRDTCPDSSSSSNYILPVTSNPPTSQVCQSQNDGSSCLYALSADKTYYQATMENKPCFTSDIPDYDEDDLTQPTGTDCQDIGNNITACPESPKNVCTNGTCQTGCGYVTIKSVKQFMCLSEDTDKDGIGDYADPDIDGDGTPNESDLDVDGDGKEEPKYKKDKNNTRTTIVNIDADAIGKAVSNYLGGPLTETGNFETSTIEKQVKAKATQLDTDTQTLLESNNFDFTNTLSETKAKQVWDPVKKVLTPSACDATFTVPFSNEDFDLCPGLQKSKVIQSIILAIATFIYCIYRVISTIRGDE